jgi:hypothetical protein
LVGRPPAGVDGVDVGHDRQDVGTELGGQHRAGEVLVDHGLDADEPPARRHRFVDVHDGDATAARADHHAVALEHPPDGLDAEDPPR